MKKYIALLIACCLIVSLAACGSAPKQEETTAPETEATQAPETEATTEETAASEEAPAEETENTEIAEKIAIANSLIDEPVEKLYEAIGYPESSDYAPSCLTLGAEDGNLYYDGFIVYTIRNGENETVYYVE